MLAPLVGRGSRCMVSLGTVRRVNEHPRASPTVLGGGGGGGGGGGESSALKLESGLPVAAGDAFKSDSRTHRNVHLCTL